MKIDMTKSTGYDGSRSLGCGKKCEFVAEHRIGALRPVSREDSNGVSKTEQQFGYTVDHILGQNSEDVKAVMDNGWMVGFSTNVPGLNWQGCTQRKNALACSYPSDLRKKGWLADVLRTSTYHAWMGLQL